MKSFKKILALLLAVALLATLLAACGTSEEPSGDNTGNTGNTGTGEIDYGDEDDTEITEINFWIYDVYTNGETHGERIEAAINAISEAEIGVHANITFMQIGDWLTKFQLGVSGGDQIDLATLCVGSTVGSLHASNMLTDVTELMPQYAPQTMELLGDYVAAYTIDGRLWGVPTMRGYVTNGYISFNKDVLDQYNLTERMESCSSFSEFESILADLTAEISGTGTYALSAGAGALFSGTGTLMRGDSFSDIEVFDNLGDSLGVIYSDADGHVGSRYGDPAYEEEAKLAKRWMDAGYIFPDSMIDAATSAQENIKASAAVGEFCSSEYGVENSKSSFYGSPALCVKLYDGQIKSGNLNSWGMGIPISAEEPEAACKFIELLYTNSDVMTLLINGEEGTDYTLVDGQAQQIEGQYQAANFVLGNNLLTIPGIGNGADYYQQIDELNKSAEVSPYLGFVLNTADMDLMISQISAVTDQYSTAMSCGGYTESSYDEFLSKLDAAGLQDYISAVQTQLDAWLAQ